ncbi:MAG: glycosyltransferase family 9 protein [Deltaproteobacteria bacterium]|nr:glycosyltransferase family 9 protein [Deltaproteobacteria bacterium]
MRLTQIVDFWVGVPLCFLLACLRGVLKPFRSKSRPVPKRVLFLEISEMGSAIIAYSSIAHLKEQLQTEELFFLIFEKNRESVELLGLIPPQNIIGLSDRSFLAFTFGVLKALVKVRRLKIDSAIDLELFSRFTAIFSLLCGAKNRVGFSNYTAEGLYRGSFLTHPVFYNPHQHMALNFLALVESLVVPAEERPLLKRNVGVLVRDLPRFEPSTEEKQRLESLLKSINPEFSTSRQLIVINPDPGEALPIRGWPLENFIQSVTQLAARLPYAMFAVIGLERSKPYAEAIAAVLTPDRFLDLCGKTKTLREVVTLFSFSQLLIGNDSGPAHFAALTDIRIISLFGPETPALYGPLSSMAVNIWAGYACAPCLSAHNHRFTCCRNNRCLQAIPPEKVSAVALELLGSGSAAVSKSRLDPALP